MSNIKLGKGCLIGCTSVIVFCAVFFGAVFFIGNLIDKSDNSVVESSFSRNENVSSYADDDSEQSETQEENTIQTDIETTQAEQETTNTEPEFISFEIELSDGYYISGIDFPEGKYNIDIVSGNGNVSSSNMWDGGINAIMGLDDDDMYQKSYKNISLPEGEYLHVRGNICVKISSEKANPAPLKERQQEISETITLSNGYFIAGEDFPCGIYDIVAIDGDGNVVVNTSDDDLIVNSIMGIGAEDEFSTESYKNVPFDENTTIKIDRVTIELIPST